MSKYWVLFVLPLLLSCHPSDKHDASGPAVTGTRTAALDDALGARGEAPPAPAERPDTGPVAPPAAPDETASSSEGRFVTIEDLDHGRVEKEWLEPGDVVILTSFTGISSDVPNEYHYEYQEGDATPRAAPRSRRPSEPTSTRSSGSGARR